MARTMFQSEPSVISSDQAMVTSSSSDQNAGPNVSPLFGRNIVGSANASGRMTFQPIPSVVSSAHMAMAPSTLDQNYIPNLSALYARDNSIAGSVLNAPGNTMQQLLLQQELSLPLLGNCFSRLQHQLAGQTADLSTLLMGMASQPQPVMGGSRSYLHEQQGAWSVPAAVGAPFSHLHSSAPLTIPGASFSNLSSRIPNFFGTLPLQRAPTTAQEVETVLSTIAAATAASKSACTQLREQEETTPAGGYPAILVYMDCDEESLSDYQCMLRKQIELFEATQEDVQWNAQGRNKAIVLGQVGLRCRYCASLPTWSRARGAVYYSSTLGGLYQAAQNMAKNHLCRHCRLIPEDMKRKLVALRDCKRRAAGGKKYWAEGANVLGVHQVGVDGGLRFKESSTGVKQEPYTENSGS